MIDVDRPVETPAALYKARKALELTQAELAEALRLKGNGERTVRRWEKGEIEISGPAQIAVEWLLEQRFGAMLDMPEHDDDARDVPDQTPTRALYVSILDNAHRPDVVKALADRWWAKDRDLLNTLLTDPNRLSLAQFQALDNCAP